MKKRMRGIPVVILLVLLPCLPFILAFITYLIRYAAEQGPLRLAQLSDALYDALDIYSMSVASYSPDSVSALDSWGRFGRPLLELARWSALIAVAAGRRKAEAIAAVTKTRRYAMLVTDEGAARAILGL